MPSGIQPLYLVYQAKLTKHPASRLCDQRPESQARRRASSAATHHRPSKTSVNADRLMRTWTSFTAHIAAAVSPATEPNQLRPSHQRSSTVNVPANWLGHMAPALEGPKKIKVHSI